MQLNYNVKERYFARNNNLAFLNPATLDKIFSKFYKDFTKEFKNKSGIENLNFPYSKLTKQQLNLLGKNN